MDGGCPFQHLSAEGLREFIPQKMAELPDIEDVFKFKNFGLPQRACAVYLSCHQKFFKNRENRFVVSNADVKTVPLIISPLQYYNISKQILEN